MGYTDKEQCDLRVSKLAQYLLRSIVLAQKLYRNDCV